MTLMLIGLLVIIALQLAVIVFIVHSNTRERADLLQRIQAPEAAVIQHASGHFPPDPEQLPFDDDRAFFESREELVRQMAAADGVSL